MAWTHNPHQSVWRLERAVSSGNAENALQNLSHFSVLVFALTAVIVGIIASLSLFSGFGLRTGFAFIVVVVLLPILCGLLVKERWRAKKLEARVRTELGNPHVVEALSDADEDAPAGLLIVSHDLTVSFANQTCLRSMQRKRSEVLGRRVQDAIPAEGLESYVTSLLARKDPAASCCLNGLIRPGLGVEWPVHITMARIAPWQGKDRILVVVEDAVPGWFLQTAELCAS